VRGLPQGVQAGTSERRSRSRARPLIAGPLPSRVTAARRWTSAPSRSGVNGSSRQRCERTLNPYGTGFARLVDDGSHGYAFRGSPVPGWWEFPHPTGKVRGTASPSLT
jgi:hypothetical protein